MKKTIKEIRTEKRLTQGEVANALRMSQSVFSLKESGKRKWDMSEAIRLTRFFNLTLDDVDWMIKVD